MALQSSTQKQNLVNVSIESNEVVKLLHYIPYSALCDVNIQPINMFMCRRVCLDGLGEANEKGEKKERRKEGENTSKLG